MSYISHSEFKHLMSKFQAETPKGMLKEAVDVKDRGYQDNITPESPLDEEDEMEEGNAFTGQLHKHKPGEKFKVGGKAYKDTAKGVVPEYKFDQMYPEDPGPFEGEMEESIYEPLQKATGVNVGITKEETNNTNPPYGFSVLSPDERKQLKEYIESLKTIKKEISTLLEKAGKSTMMESNKAGYVKGGEIKNKKKETDTKHPATIKAKYHEPTHKQKTGGDRTNLVMKKSEMWEGHESDMDPKHEEMESKIDPKLHDVIHKVVDEVISELEAAGFTRQEALMFLDHEIAEKGEEAKMDQYNPF